MNAHTFEKLKNTSNSQLEQLHRLRDTQTFSQFEENMSKTHLPPSGPRIIPPKEINHDGETKFPDSPHVFSFTVEPLRFSHTRTNEHTGTGELGRRRRGQSSSFAFIRIPNLRQISFVQFRARVNCFRSLSPPRMRLFIYSLIYRQSDTRESQVNWL